MLLYSYRSLYWTAALLDDLIMPYYMSQNSPTFFESLFCVLPLLQLYTYIFSHTFTIHIRPQKKSQYCFSANSLGLSLFNQTFMNNSYLYLHLYYATAFAFIFSIAFRIAAHTVKSVKISTTLP